MNINQYKIIREKDGYSVVIYLDPQLEEFGGELGTILQSGPHLKLQIQQLVRNKFPKLKINTAKVMVGSILVTTISLGPTFFNNQVEAAPYSNASTIQIEYIVQSGDSLSVIAKKYGTTVDVLMDTNNLKSTLIKVGQRLKIPTTGNVYPNQPSDTKSPITVSDTSYTVVAGDSLSVIAKRFNTTVQEIKRLNGLTSDTIYVGQTLKLREKTDTKDNVRTTVPSTYTVMSGDSLSVIAKRFNTTVTELIQLNQLSSDRIFVGQTLKIPGKTTEPVNEPTENEGQLGEQELQEGIQTKTYIVMSGDTLSKLAKQFNTTINTIKQVNNLSSDTIYIGQKLQIPSTDEEGVEEDATAPTAPILHTLNPIHSSNQNSYIISGKTDPNNTVHLTFTDETGQKIEREFQSDTNGIFSNTLSLADLEDGTIQIITTSTDQFRNTSNETIETIVKDTTVVDTTFFKLVPITRENAHQYSVMGNAEPGATVFFTLRDSNNTDIFLQTTVNETGNFQIAIDTSTLSDGPITLTSYTVDQVGNKSESKTATIVKETFIPAPVIGSIKLINVENASNYTIVGTARPNAPVEVTISDGVTPNIVKQTTADLNGEFLIQADVSTLLDKELIITASQLTVNGIKSEVAKTKIEKDTTAPSIPDLKISDFINQKSQTNFDINGTAEKNAKIFVKVIDQDKNTIETSGKVQENGQFHIPIDLSTQTDGEITMEVYQVDKAGNLSATSKKVLTKDTIAPEQIEVEALPGIYSGNETDFHIQGITEPLLQIEMTITDGVASETYSMMTDGVGKFSKSVDMSSFKDGEISITFNGIDKAGNKNELKTMGLIKDTIIENIQLDEMDEFVNRSNQNEFILSGDSTEEGATITVVASDGTNVLTETTNVEAGKFHLPIDLSSLKDGPITLEFSKKDIYKNERVLGVQTIQKDTVVETPIISTNGFFYQGNQLIFGLNGSVESEADVTVTFYDQNNNVITNQSTKADKNGFYSILFTMNENDRTKISRTAVTQTDVAGNTSEIASIPLNTHTVSAGETLYELAKLYNTSVDALQMVNQLENESIQAGQTIILPLTASEVINLGYMYYGDLEDSQKFISETAGSMNIVAPSYFEINPDGTLKITWALNTEFVEAMHDQGIRVVPYLSNNWDRELGRAMLRNKEVATTQIAEAIERYNLDGVNVDIENVTHVDQADFTEFIRLLREKIPTHKEVSVAVAANPNGWTEGWHGSYDYKKLAESSDYLMFMTYDESYVGGEPGPVASYNWVERSIIQALREGIRSDQIVLGIAQYGRYWKDGAQVGGYGISNRQVEKLIAQYGGTVLFDEESLSPVAKITIDVNDPKPTVNGKTLSAGTYTIWYENEESIRYKLTLVSKYNLRGVGNWNIIQGTDGIWNNYATGLPDSVPVSAPYIPPVEDILEGQTYTVVSGDSLSKIALKFGTTINEIKELNHLTSDMIYLGQTLLIPDGNESEGFEPIEDTPDPSIEEVDAPIAEEEPPIPSNDEPEEDVKPADNTAPTKPIEDANTYVVSSGDSLSGLAKKFNTTVHAIKSANNLSTDTIYIGQSLKIPTSTTIDTEQGIPITYTVKSGDSLSVIAKIYNTSVEAIKSANHLSRDTIYIGQHLVIPQGEKISEERTVINYTVKSGDSLSLIAKRYHSNVNDIKQANDLKSDLIRIGQVLKIPI